jgi:hypothetical protein
MEVVNFGGDAIAHIPTNNILNKQQVDYINNLDFKPKTPKGNRVSVSFNILDNPLMKSVRDWFSNYIGIYTQQIWGISNQFILCNSWATINEPGASHAKHHHPNAILALSYYIQVKDGKIYFEKVRTPIQNGFLFDYDIIKPTDYNATTHKFSLNNGDICIFPGHMEHGTTENTSSTPRVMIAANYFIKGKIGANESLTYLEL